MSKLCSKIIILFRRQFWNKKEMYYCMKETQSPRSMYLKEPFKSNLGLQ